MLVFYDSPIGKTIVIREKILFENDVLSFIYAIQCKNISYQPSESAK